MARTAEPVVLELASLPREQMGPFLLLGLDKADDAKAVEEHWAERVKWARRNAIKTPLEDINWARDVMNDADRRMKADVGGLNVDTSDRRLDTLADAFGAGKGQASRQWQPIDAEKSLASYEPAAELPDRQSVRDAVVLPDVPDDLPAAPAMLAELSRAAIDPWAADLLGVN